MQRVPATGWEARMAVRQRVDVVALGCNLARGLRGKLVSAIVLSPTA